MATATKVALLALALTAGAARAASLEEGMALKREAKLAQAEQVFAEVVRDHPTDAAALAQWATVLGWLGRLDDSAGAWQRALAQKPDDPDATLGLARVRYWKGDLGAAQASLHGLLARAPENVDALTLGGDVAVAAGDLSAARDLYRRAAALAPSPELAQKLARARGPRAFRLDAGGQIDGYDTPPGTDTRGTEGSFFAQGSWQAARPLVVSAGYEQLRQFGKVDHRVNVGGYLSPAQRLLLVARFAVSPTADTVAPWEASGGAEVRVAGPFTATASVRHLDFTQQGVTIVGGGARVALGRLTLGGEGGIVHSTIDSLHGFGIGRAELAVNDDWRLYAGFARGEQTQVLLPPAIATDVVAGVLWQVDEQWGARLDYTHETYGDAYVRNSVGTALTFKF